MSWFTMAGVPAPCKDRTVLEEITLSRGMDKPYRGTVILTNGIEQTIYWLGL
jgi:hypothetical protein